jgi:Nucleotidyl transferase AbiEii toxin, Type IV TA system
VLQLLQALNAPLLKQSGCYFGGGTAIVLLLGEYRESVDVDLLCASAEGYRTLRNVVNERSLGDVLAQPVTLVRDVRADRYGIRTFCELDGTPIKLEIVREDRISLTGEDHAGLPITVRLWRQRGAGTEPRL